jgi:hypothetical protein
MQLNVLQAKVQYHLSSRLPVPLIHFHSEVAVVGGERRLIMTPKLYQDLLSTELGHLSFLQMVPQTSRMVSNTECSVHTKYA